MANEKKIRARCGYRIFHELALWFTKESRTVKEFLLEVYEIIDNHKGFHSQKNSDFALESIRQVVKDLKIESNDEKLKEHKYGKNKK